jgi:hypothetical protein
MAGDAAQAAKVEIRMVARIKDVLFWDRKRADFFCQCVPI